MVLLPDVNLTSEELAECQTHLGALFPSTHEGAWHMKEELVEPFRRSMMAMSLIGQAKRFALLARRQPEQRSKACETAAKACALYPLSAYFYDFAELLEGFGIREEARTLYAQFLQQPEAGPVQEIDEILLGQRNIAGMVAHAKQVTIVDEGGAFAG